MRRQLLTWMGIVLVVGVLGEASVAQAKNKRPRNLSRVLASVDPNRAEQILAKIPPRDRLQDTDWLKIIGDRKAQSYTVQAGDNLWTIAHKVIADPFLWRKLWQENPYLTNPHQLQVGQVLNYYKEPTADRALASDAIPIVKLSPLKGDLNNITFSNVVIKNRFRPAFFVMDENQEPLGEVTGAFAKKAAVMQIDRAYVQFKNPESAKVGDRFSVIHVERAIPDRSSTDGHILGNLVRLVGEITLIEKGENHFVANVDSVLTMMKRGDRIIPLQMPVLTHPYELPPADLQARVVMGDEPEKKLFVTGQMVLLNKGTVDGMKTGYDFRVYREDDPNTDSAKGVEPDWLGEIQVIQAGTLSSVGYVVACDEPIRIGDTLIPRQSFVDRPPSPKRPTQTLEID